MSSATEQPGVACATDCPAGRRRALAGRWAPRLPPGRSGRFSRTFLTALVVLVALGSFFKIINAGFIGSTPNTGNTFQAGTVIITDDDGGSGSILTLSNAAVGATSTGCIEVTNTGTAPSNVKMYSSVTGAGLDAYLNLTITRGTLSAAAFPSCASFTADAATYAAPGGANGVVYTGTLAALRTTYNTYASGLVDPTAGSPETWATNEKHAFKFVATVVTGGEGLTTTPTFTWDASDL